VAFAGASARTGWSVPVAPNPTTAVAASATTADAALMAVVCGLVVARQVKRIPFLQKRQAASGIVDQVAETGLQQYFGCLNCS
jgi:hypothetical protein